MSDKAESSPQRQVNRVVLLEYPLWELRDLGELEELKDVVPGQAERQQWESWLRNQKPPHYSA